MGLGQIGMNVFSLATGISQGDLVKHALKFVGVPEGVAAGIGALADLKTGNYVGAFQNGKQAFEALGGKNGCASAQSCERPSGVIGTVLKAGFTAAAVIGGGALLGSALKGTALGGLAKLMLGAAGIMALVKGGGALLGGGGGLLAGAAGLAAGGGAANLLFANNPFQGETAMRRATGTSYANGGPGSAVGRLPANATFEDLVAAFMVDTVKDMQDEAKAKMDEIRKSIDKNEGQGGGIFGGLKSAFGGIVGMVPFVGKGIQNAMQGNAQKGDDSRNLMFEELKYTMQKLSQCQQALSNVLNTMHEQAMGAIRHIKA